MITYARVEHPNGVRYTKNNIFVKENSVPPEVKQKLTFAKEIAYDEKPSKKRCLFCEAPESYQRFVSGLMVLLCNDHYYSENVGRITAQLRLVEQEKEKHEPDPQKGRKPKRKQRASAES